MEKAFVFDKGCEHCQNNPNGTKPYIPLKWIRMTNLTDTLAGKEAERVGVKPGCVVCKIVQDFCKGVSEHEPDKN